MTDENKWQTRPVLAAEYKGTVKLHVSLGPTAEDEENRHLAEDYTRMSLAEALAKLEENGYAGLIGFELIPKTTTAQAVRAIARL